MPAHSKLTQALAEKAFKIIGKPSFTVSACLAVVDAESLHNFGLLESILLMAYQQGAQDALAGSVATPSPVEAFARSSVSEAEALLGNTGLRIAMAARE